jgi:hypothetical protein
MPIPSSNPMALKLRSMGWSAPVPVLQFALKRRKLSMT